MAASVTAGRLAALDEPRKPEHILPPREVAAHWSLRRIGTRRRIVAICNRPIGRPVGRRDMPGMASANQPHRRLPGFGIQVAIGMIAGLALGLAARSAGDGGAWLGETLATTGSIFVQLLKAVVAPLIFTAIIASIAELGGLANGARLAVRTLLWFAATAAIAVVIGLAIGLILEPGLHAGVSAEAAKAPTTVGGWTDFLKGLIPSNAFGLSAGTTIGDDGRATTVLLGGRQPGSAGCLPHRERAGQVDVAERTLSCEGLRSEPDR